MNNFYRASPNNNRIDCETQQKNTKIQRKPQTEINLTWLTIQKFLLVRFSFELMETLPDSAP